MNDLIIPLDNSSREPIYEQIYRYIKEEIRNGSLPFHGRLPSTRALARHMQISRSTVDMAYAQLTAEGYLEAVPCKGYYVAQMDELFVSPRQQPDPEDNQVNVKVEYRYDFSPRGIDLRSFPYNVWRRLTKNTLIDDKREIFELGDPKGDYALRNMICQYLHQARGVNCSPEQMVIGAGNEYLLMRLSQLLPSGCQIAMENPTYRQAYRILCGLGHKVVPVPMDEGGMEIEALEKSGAMLSYVMPSHQYPLGIVMPIKRRLELLAWAAKGERYIIEDDYDSEFRYRGMPIPSLQGVDRKDRVIYIGTFSKSVAPAIRISYMVLPHALLKRFESYNYYSSTVSRIDQTVMESFISEGHFERHLNRMRTIYKNKHDVLMNELKDFSDFSISGENAGLHLLLTGSREEQELIELAARQDVRVYGLSDYYITDTGRQHKTVVLGYANMTEEEIKEGAAHLKEAWR